ncbi:MAG: hypothetical protein ACYYKD_12740 [Rhodospirillales bacterium]
MARKASPAKPKKPAKAKPKAGPKTRAKSPPDARAAVLRAALNIAAGGRWPGAEISDIAAEAGLSRAQTAAHLPHPSAALRLVASEADRRVLDSIETDPVDAQAPAKDRLFDLMMRRFDALQDMREGALVLIGAALRDPAAAALAVSRAARSMALMLEAAGISSAGPLGAVRVKGLMIVYAQTLRAWRADDSPDMAAVMAALDTALSRGEAVMNRLSSCGPPSCGPQSRGPFGRRAQTAPAGDKSAADEPHDG